MRSIRLYVFLKSERENGRRGELDTIHAAGVLLARLGTTNSNIPAIVVGVAIMMRRCSIILLDWRNNLQLMSSLVMLVDVSCYWS